MKAFFISSALLVLGLFVWFFTGQSYYDKDYSTNGIWSGKFDINGKGTYDFTALYIDGEAVAVSNDTNMVYYGRVENDQERYESQLAMYLKSRGTKFGEVELSGTFTAPGQIDAQFLTMSDDQGKLLLTSDTDLFYREVSVQQVAGKWILYQGMTILKFTIQSNGYIRGANTQGCEYEGNISPKQQGINAYKLHFFVSSCNYLDGEMHGLAYLDSSVKKDDTLNIHLFNQTVGLFLPLVRDQNTNSMPAKETRPL